MRQIIKLTIVMAVFLCVLPEVYALQKNQSVAKINIKDIFIMLPKGACPLDQSHRKELLKDKSNFPGICDTRNAYLSIERAQFTWEMCYWNMKDGRKLVAVNQNTEEQGSKIRISFYENGTLYEDKNYRLAGNRKFKPSDFIDVSRLEADIRKQVEQNFATGKYNLYYQLPQKGTSVIITLDTYSLLNYSDEIPYEICKDVVLQWNGKTFNAPISRSHNNNEQE